MKSEKYKQAIVLNKDLDISTGKKISQACHASLNSYEKAESKIQEKWKSQGAKKIVIKSKNLKDLSSKAENLDISYSLVKDAGKTEVEKGTLTALGVGPASENLIDKVTGQLELVE